MVGGKNLVDPLYVFLYILPCNGFPLSFWVSLLKYSGKIPLHFLLAPTTTTRTTTTSTTTTTYMPLRTDPPPMSMESSETYGDSGTESVESEYDESRSDPYSYESRGEYESTYSEDGSWLEDGRSSEYSGAYSRNNFWNATMEYYEYRRSINRFRNRN